MPQRRRRLVVDGQAATRPTHDGRVSLQLCPAAAGGLCARQPVGESHAQPGGQRPEELDRESDAQERASQEKKALPRLQDCCGARCRSEGSNSDSDSYTNTTSNSDYAPEADEIVASTHSDIRSGASPIYPSMAAEKKS